MLPAGVTATARRMGKNPPCQNCVGELDALPEQQRFQVGHGLSVCLPAEPRHIHRRNGAGLQCITSKGAYYAYCCTAHRSSDASTTVSARSQSAAVSESQLTADSNAMLDIQIAQLARDSGKNILHNEPIRIGVHRARRITYRTQVDYGDGFVDAHTIIVALAPQGKVCHFTFVPSTTCPSRTAIYADRFFATIRPAVQLGDPAK